MKDTRLILLAQALAATFLWSASKIILKLGLGFATPLLLAGCTQAVALVSLVIYSLFHPIKLSQPFKKMEISVLVLLGIMGFVVAPLFAVIGLKYVAGTTAGLFAGLGSALVMFLSWTILREKPRSWQVIGGLVAFVGAYIFLFDNKLMGSSFGILMIVLSELSYALNIVLTRLIMRRPGNDALIVALVGSALGTTILLPLGLTENSWAALGQWQVWLVIITVGLIFAFAGLLWNSALNYLLSFEAAIFQNTMLIQVGLLSAIFLRETITPYNLIGAIIVLAGAYLVSRPQPSSKHYVHSGN
ncbi:MAG: DMT family transporter [Patescibacteria group bacterium]